MNKKVLYLFFFIIVVINISCKKKPEAEISPDLVLTGYVNPILKGKNFVIIGDSFTEDTRLYRDTLVGRSGINLVGVNAIGGRALTGGMGNAVGDGRIRKPAVDVIDEILNGQTNVDGIIIQIGGNDWVYSSPLGVLGTTDTLTYYGALDYVAKRCLAYRDIKKRKLQIVPVTMTQFNTAPAFGIAGASNYSRQRLYVDAMLAVFSKYDITVADEFDNSGFVYSNSDITTTDGTHPSIIGTRAYVTALLTSMSAYKW